MDKRPLKIILFVFVVLVVLNCDITITKDNKYTKINNIFSVLFTDKPLIEKGINNK